MSADLMLTAGIDTTQAKQDLDQLANYAKKKLSDIKAAAAAAAKIGVGSGSGGSRPGAGGAGIDPLATAKAQLAAQRQIENALNRELGMRLRVERQLGNDAVMQGKLTSATQAYIETLRRVGTNTMEGVKAAGIFRRELTQMNEGLTD